MPIVTFNGKELSCEKGKNLRHLLFENCETPHNGAANYLNCHGIGTCGTCSVEIRGELPPQTLRDRLRHRFPPHKARPRRRLACQTQVLGDMVVTKHSGFWGQKT